ncbi:MAG: sugar ABC transporter permease, partial [Clostridiales bacterium]|nr:sugar ABC transporter permease [Clostridiales bacterium]
MVANARKTPATRRSPLTQITRHWQWYLILLAPIALTLIFRYWPMYGAVIAFKQYTSGSIWAAKWVGLKHFENFFRTPVFGRV